MDGAWQEELSRVQHQRQSVSVAQTETASNPVSFLQYLPAFLVAVLKDILDLVGIGSLPAVGTVVTICFSFLIFLLLLISGSSGKYTLTRKGLMLLGGTLIEGIFFGLNLFPLEALTVYMIYRGDKKAANNNFTLEA